MTYVLDSSALFALLLDEEGGARVAELLACPRNRFVLSALAAVELWASLKSQGRETAFSAEWHAVRELVSGIRAVDERVSVCAAFLRGQTPTRLPAMDALIAASAHLEQATLLHRDPHFTAIPEDLLAQEMVG